jgi:serine protease Do
MLTAVVGELEDATQRPSQVRSGKDVGLTVTELTPGLARRYGYKTTEGLLITSVAQGSEADRKGIQDGDIILEVNRARISSVDQWERILDRAKTGDVIMLLVRREGDGASQDFIVSLRIP